MRPWMGLHAIDTVRRDAAMRGIRAETRRIDDDLAAITMKKDKLEIIYTISLSRDWIESITLNGGGSQGTLSFSYPANPDDRSTEPAMVPSTYHHDQAGDWWLTHDGVGRGRLQAVSVLWGEYNEIRDRRSGVSRRDAGGVGGTCLQSGNTNTRMIFQPIHGRPIVSTIPCCGRSGFIPSSALPYFGLLIPTVASAWILGVWRDGGT
jgi:hypothetical protein